MDYGITSNKPNIDFAAKEYITSQQSGIFPLVATGGTYQDVGVGLTLTISKTGLYKITCKTHADITYTTNNQNSAVLRLARNGAEITGTVTQPYKNTAAIAGSFVFPISIEAPLQMFTAGDVIALQGYKTNTDVLNVFANAVYQGFIQAEMKSAYVNVYDSDKIYSTTEINTGRTWIDGKSIYRKVIDFGAMPNAALKVVAHGITTPDVIVNMYGTARNTTTNDKRVLPHVNISGAGSSIQMIADNTNISIHSGTTDRTALNECYITMEYTKV